MTWNSQLESSNLSVQAPLLWKLGQAHYLYFITIYVFRSIFFVSPFSLFPCSSFFRFSVILIFIRKFFSSTDCSIFFCCLRREKVAAVPSQNKPYGRKLRSKNCSKFGNISRVRIKQNQLWKEIFFGAGFIIFILRWVRCTWYESNSFRQHCRAWDPNYVLVIDVRCRSQHKKLPSHYSHVTQIFILGKTSRAQESNPG